MKAQFLMIYDLIFCSFSLFFALFLVSKPSLAIELQKRFYARINWKIEPISLERELRHTRIMGIILTVLSLAALFYSLTIRAIP